MPSSSQARFLQPVFAGNEDRGFRQDAHAVIINTSRGPLIDHAALWAALQAKRIGGAGLDVFEPEPPNLADPLYSDSRVIATPHIAFVSAESLINLRERTAQQVVDVLQGRVPENVINPQVLQGR